MRCGNDLKLRLYFLSFSLNHIRDKIGRTAHDGIENIGYNECESVRESRAYRSEEEGIAPEEHIVCAEYDISRIREYRHYVCGDDREEAIEDIIRVVDTMIARGHKHEGTEDERTMIEEGLEAGEGYRRVLSEYRCRIYEVDKTAEKTERTDVAAGGIAHAALAPDHEGHRVHPYATGVDGEIADPVKGNRATRGRLPDEL